MHLWYPRPEDNPYCKCYPDREWIFWCQTGHMTECHYPYGCAEGGCGHLERYHMNDRVIDEIRARAKVRIAKPNSYYWVADDTGQVHAKPKIEGGVS